MKCHHHLVAIVLIATGYVRCETCPDTITYDAPRWSGALSTSAATDGFPLARDPIPACSFGTRDYPEGFGSIFFTGMGLVRNDLIARHCDPAATNNETCTQMAMTVHLREPVALGVTRLLEGEAFSGQNHDPRNDKAWVNFSAASGTSPGEHDSLSTDYFLESGTVTTTALESDRGSADFVLRFRPNPVYEDLLRSLGLWYDWLEFTGSCTTVLIRQSFCEE